MTREIYKNWCIAYFNESGQFHREDDKPSFIRFDGNISFRKKDKTHRQGKPSSILPNGTLFYWENDKFVKYIEL